MRYQNILTRKFMGVYGYFWPVLLALGYAVYKNYQDLDDESELRVFG